MDRVLIHHDSNLSPGTWRLSGDQPVYRCPQCHVVKVIVQAVEADGKLGAPIYCFAPCGNYVFGTLDQWTHGEKARGKAVGE